MFAAVRTSADGRFLNFGTMTQKIITLQGKQYPVVFGMKTMVGYEEIVGKGWFTTDWSDVKFRERMAVVVAAILAANEKSKISADDLLSIDNVDDMKELIKAFNDIMELSTEFFKLPAVEKTDEKPAENAKN